MLDFFRDHVKKKEKDELALNPCKSIQPGSAWPPRFPVVHLRPSSSCDAVVSYLTQIPSLDAPRPSHPKFNIPVLLRLPTRPTNRRTSPSQSNPGAPLHESIPRLPIPLAPAAHCKQLANRGETNPLETLLNPCGLLHPVPALFGPLSHGYLAPNPLRIIPSRATNRRPSTHGPIRIGLANNGPRISRLYTRRSSSASRKHTGGERSWPIPVLHGAARSNWCNIPSWSRP